MHIVDEYPDGVFCWVDLTTTDIAAAKSFYGGLFGWTARDTPMDSGATYTTFEIDGYRVAGGGEMPPDMRASGMPPVWASMVKHSNVDEIAERIQAAGGQLFMPPMDVMTEGRMVMATDSTGASFGVWQPRDHNGAELVNVPNTLVWNELQTRDKATARAFYKDVFGWTDQEDDNQYVLYSVHGRLHSGQLTMDENWDAAIPSNWQVYFLVEDVAAAAARAVELGGTVVAGPMPAGQTGHMAVISDPQGAVFSIIKFNDPPDPPPGYETW